MEKLLTLRQHPEVSLKRAREKRDDARRQLSNGVGSTLKRRAEEDAATNTFKAVDDTYNRAQCLAGRRVMMQNLADYLDRLESVEITAKHANTTD